MILISMIVFSLLVSIKGGLVGVILNKYGLGEWWDKFNSLPVIGFFCEGKFISGFLAAIYVSFFIPFWSAALFGVLWWAVWSPSLGEEIGAIGRLKHSWGQYVEWLGYDEGRKFGWKKGLQRGVLIGAGLSIPTGSALIIGSLLFPACYFCGNQIHFSLHKSDSWFYAEIIFGAVLGAAFHISVN